MGIENKSRLTGAEKKSAAEGRKWGYLQQCLCWESGEIPALEGGLLHLGNPITGFFPTFSPASLSLSPFFSPPNW